MSEKRCFNCIFFATEDTGYSDWTVEDTIIHCLHKKHPSMPREETYSWVQPDTTQDSEFMKFAINCDKYREDSEGCAVQMNVEFQPSEEPYSSCPEVNELAKKYFEE